MPYMIIFSKHATTIPDKCKDDRLIMSYHLHDRASNKDGLLMAFAIERMDGTLTLQSPASRPTRRPVRTKPRCLCPPCTGPAPGQTAGFLSTLTAVVPTTRNSKMPYMIIIIPKHATTIPDKCKDDREIMSYHLHDPVSNMDDFRMAIAIEHMDGLLILKGPASRPTR